ncbi:MAG: hypothetical protein CMO55_29260 [Verrucomicrobiales bacterium]|nr:hypothetical protein [Verrucomicrobiales bacterium]
MHKQTTPTPRPLSPRQKHFLDRYHITGNLGQSWLDAGYNCSFESASGNAGRILQREDAQEYLAELQEFDRQHTGLTREKILDRLEEIIDDRTAKNRDVIWACREAGRMIGAYAPKPEPKEPVRDTLHEFIRRVRAGEPVEDLETHHTPPVQHPTPSQEHQPAPEPEPQPEPTISEESAPEPQDSAPSPVAQDLTNHPHYHQRVKAEMDADRRDPNRDPNWHPQYNPYYDPTNQAYQTRKRRRNITIRPGMR